MPSDSKRLWKDSDWKFISDSQLCKLVNRLPTPTHQSCLSRKKQ